MEMNRLLNNSGMDVEHIRWQREELLLRSDNRQSLHFPLQIISMPFAPEPKDKYETKMRDRRESEKELERNR